MMKQATSTHIRQFGYVRTLGLFLVLLYHFYPNIFPGGFIGVDIFFVFSGYLITALALEEFRRTHEFSLKKFAERRFFRIFPTIAFSMVIVLPLTLFGNSDLRYNLSQQVFAGLGFISNLYESSTGVSYANSFAPHIFIHLWSLALEVQFYVIWGVIIYFLSRRLRQGLKEWTFLLSAVIFIISSVAMLIASTRTNSYSFLYYSPLFHIFPFFLGAMLASIGGIYATPMIKKLARHWSFIRICLTTIVSGFILILLAFFLHFDSKFTYILGFVLATIAAFVLILCLRLLHEVTMAEEPRIIRFIADVSYGVYVFHWPFLIIFENYKLPYIISVFLTVVLSFALSAFMFYIIDPVLRGRHRYPQIPMMFVGWVLVFLLIPSGMALSETSNQTSLSQTLWTGSNQQTAQQLAFSEKLIKTGAAGAENLVIGDSVALGTTTSSSSAPILQKEIPKTYADTAGDRRISANLLNTLTTDLSMMPKNCTIVIALGTNSTRPEKDIEILKRVIKEYSGKHHIVLVTPADWRAGGPFNSDQIADWEISIKGKYKNVNIADWRAVSEDHPEYFDVDGTHIGDRPAGRAAWIKLVKATLTEKVDIPA